MPAKQLKKHRTRLEPLDFVIHATLISLVIIILYPVLHIMSVSFSSTVAYRQGISFYPKDIDLSAYRSIFAAGNVMNGFKNSVKYTVLGTIINVICTSMVGFALSRPRLAFRRIYMIYVMIPMYFGGGLIPSYLNVINLGLYNTTWAMVLPGAIAVWNLIIMRTFFASIPLELDESAHVDGAGDITIFLRIIIPVAKAGIATIALFYLSAHWNSWFAAMIYLREVEKYPLQLLIRRIVMEEFLAQELSALHGLTDQPVTQDAIKYATIVIAIMPMLAVYPFIQKYFVKGVMIGSIKG
jgi:putative aldouronate transport system permease protein